MGTKKVKSRKHNVVVDTMGFPLVANLSDSKEAYAIQKLYFSGLVQSK